MLFPDGHTEIVPMARRRALMSEPDRHLREASFYAGQKPWNDHADTLAAGLNGIAGTRLVEESITFSRRRFSTVH